MGGYHTEYEGSKSYGLSNNYNSGGTFLGFDATYRVTPSEIGVSTDPRTSNQLKAVSDKISSGTNIVEVSGITMQQLDYMPKQQFTELNRLRKLTGVDLTFHGPLVEPTGVIEGRWDESQRQQVENQMVSAVERGQQLDSDGNVVITFHASNGLQEPKTVVKGENGKEETVALGIINERAGEIRAISKSKQNWLLDDKKDINNELKRINEESWRSSLSNIGFETLRAKQYLGEALRGDENAALESTGEAKSIPELYKLSKDSPEKYEKIIEGLGKTVPQIAQALQNKVSQVSNSEIFLRNSYTSFQELFNMAYESAKKNAEKGQTKDLQMLDKYRKEAKEDLKDPTKVIEFERKLEEGLRVLDSIESPQIYRKLDEFAIEKAAETFGNTAFRAFKHFEKEGKKSPIISIENPPVGMGITRAEDLKKLIEEARDVFVENAKKTGMNEGKAKEQAAKLIGATWDVGHINLLRKYGYDEKDIVKQTETIAPFVKHVHLSDNFGLEHTELPMGMGNVPTKKHMELIAKYNKTAKKIVETGGWYQWFQKTPLRETFEAFGSPIYGMKMSPTWNQTPGLLSGSYNAGYGLNPDIHHQMYGAGFSNLPVELGGQTGGGRNRLSGAPME